MKPAGRREELAAAYVSLLQKLGRSELCAQAEHPLPLPADAELETLWADGLLPGAGCETLAHGPVQVLDAGMWNRGEGPDFLRAHLKIQDVRIQGDVELSRAAEDWVAAGHEENPLFNDVVLHVVLTPPPAGWFTRNAQHRNIPVLYVPEERWAVACGRRRFPVDLEACVAPLEQMPLGQLVTLMQAAAARRAEHKRFLFSARAALVGDAQAWYEALAATLGYSANKQAMAWLARRAPLESLGDDAEAILFGTSGFLLPVLPERADESCRVYHRYVWDAWWPLREQYGLADCRRIPWKLAAGRPLNHPHRRVAALAQAAMRWREIEPHLNVEGVPELERVFASLRHPYWDVHSSLPSAPLQRPAALMGKARVRDFLLNHVYVQDDSAGTWQAYLCLRAAELPQRVRRIARTLLGVRADVAPLLKLCFAQQALLQLERDCRFEGGYPAALAGWRL